MTLVEFVKKELTNKKTWEKAVEKLQNRNFVFNQGWKYVWHEGYGMGICSPSENIVVIYEEDDVNYCNAYGFYKYNPNAWVDLNWNKIYNGENGEGYEVEPIKL